MKKHIFLATPHMSDEEYELAYVKQAFADNYVAPLGKNVDAFEQALSAYSGCDHVVALSAGTAALHLSVLLAGVKPGDTVFCQDLTFSASANCVVYAGAKPVFIDSERETWNMSPDALRKAFVRYGVPRAVIVVDLYGVPAKLDEIRALCREHGTVLIEDAAEALGSTYKGQACGTFGKYGAYSFNGNKIITTSGGGALLCSTAEDAAQALKLSTQAREPFPWYEHCQIGYNYRLSNISAGIGCGQMKVLPQRLAQKRRIFAAYQEKLANLPITMQPQESCAEANRWLSTFLLHADQRRRPMDIIRALGEADIEARPLWKPMHMQPVFRDCPFVSCEETPVDEDLFARGVCLPSGTNLSDADMERICAALYHAI